LIPVCYYVPVAVGVGGQGNCADSGWDHPSLLLIFDPSFAENQPYMTSKSQ
jgi:hypothetical protein